MEKCKSEESFVRDAPPSVFESLELWQTAAKWSWAEERSSRTIFQYLHSTDFLLFLDVRDDDMDLRHDKQGKVSKVVLATGYQIVCNKVETDRSVRLDVLSDEEAWDLFSRKVGDAANSKGISPYATDVVKECYGLPLAINVLGVNAGEQQDSQGKQWQLATLPSDVSSLKKPEVLPIKDTQINFLPTGIGSNSPTNTSDSNRNSDNWNIELVVLPRPSVQSSAYPVVPESF
ncbi:hypothetical protein OIU85_012157 [Salix viminalis]|uniref:NB-ARC domain-containing protein n=1 Tax=Salix viminalis TaxID=40686 RepID=A0A9Q0SDM9_SALVM|nr:hypothetical protein OIU85_012157 [Salix viminalis]